MAAGIKVLGGRHAGSVGRIDRGDLVLTRESPTDLHWPLGDPRGTAHAIIRKEADAYWIADLATSPGTLVNGQYVFRQALGDKGTIVKARQPTAVHDEVERRPIGPAAPARPAADPDETVGTFRRRVAIDDDTTTTMRKQVAVPRPAQQPAPAPEASRPLAAPPPPHPGAATASPAGVGSASVGAPGLGSALDVGLLVALATLGIAIAAVARRGS